MRCQLFLLMIPSIVIAACSSSKITHSWRSDTGISTDFKKILIVGITGAEVLDVKERMEQHLAGDLRQLGHEVVTSVDQFGPKAFRDMTENEMLEKVRGSGFDAVVTIVLLDKLKEKYYVPGHVYYSPYIIYHRRFWGYYITMRERIYTPGYYSTSTKYFWESNLYDLQSMDLLYSVQTESFNPENTESLAHQYGKLIVKDMVNSQVLHRKNNPASLNSPIP